MISSRASMWRACSGAMASPLLLAGTARAQVTPPSPAAVAAAPGHASTERTSVVVSRLP
jgi:hypothetical protein